VIERVVVRRLPSVEVTARSAQAWSNVRPSPITPTMRLRGMVLTIVYFQILQLEQ